MAAQYTVLIAPTKVTEQEAEFINSYRRENRITISEALRRCIAALRANGHDFTRAPYGSSVRVLPSFLVDEDTAQFVQALAYEKDVSKSQVVRAAIDCLSRKEGA